MVFGRCYMSVALVRPSGVIIRSNKDTPGFRETCNIKCSLKLTVTILRGLTFLSCCKPTQLFIFFWPYSFHQLIILIFILLLLIFMLIIVIITEMEFMVRSVATVSDWPKSPQKSKGFSKTIWIVLKWKQQQQQQVKIFRNSIFHVY